MVPGRHGESGCGVGGWRGVAHSKTEHSDHFYALMKIWTHSPSQVLRNWVKSVGPPGGGRLGADRVPARLRTGPQPPGPRMDPLKLPFGEPLASLKFKFQVTPPAGVATRTPQRNLNFEF